jgi:hypothetical protein
MVPCFKWQSVLCLAFLAQAPTTWAQQEPEPQKPLRFGLVAEMKRRGQTASADCRAEVKVTLRKISSSYLGQPATFEVNIRNIGTHPTPTDASLFIKIRSTVGMEEYGLLFGEVASKEERTVRFEYTPLLPSVDMVATEGIWNSNSTGWTQPRAELRLSFHYDHKAPLTDLLPARPHTAKQQPVRLPAKLSEVPEVFFAEPFIYDNGGGTGRIQVAGALAKIKHVNQKKTDAYMELLLSQRSDLAGLPFLLGDACRTKGERRTFFAATTKHIRINQRSGSNSQLMTEVAKTLRQQSLPTGVQVAALWQMITPESAANRLELVKYMHENLTEEDAARGLAKLAIFSEEEQVRSAALDALNTRPRQDYVGILVTGLSYPWPAVVERASTAIAKLGQTDLLPQLQEVLKRPDPRLPQTRQIDGKPKTFVRELVRINHLHNCMLCHAPAVAGNGQDVAVRVGRTQEEDSTAQVPIPGEAIQQYYGESIPDLFVRFDVTYLRQDFSVTLPVEKAEPWPPMQRFDFVVRTREINEQEARALRELLPPDAASPYHRAALAAIRELSGREPDVKKSKSAQ